MAEHGIRQTGTEVLRLLYAFPVDSFDSVEYLFSANSEDAGLAAEGPRIPQPAQPAGRSRPARGAIG